MDAAEFDRFADEYYSQHQANIAITGETPEFFAEYKVRRFREMLGDAQAARAIIDFGSGIGNSIPHFRQHCPHAVLTCADVSGRSLALAAQRFPGPQQNLLIEGRRIPAPDGAFDAAFSACVFHHIPHEEHADWLAELLRVVRPGGRLAIFEHNPWNPLTVRAVNTCPFDENAHLITPTQFRRRVADAGWRDVGVRFHVFFPNRLAPLRRLDPLLAGLPLGAQYSVEATKPSQSTDGQR